MTAKITKALHEVMQKVGYVQKTGKNSFHNYKYAGEADLLDKLRPAMIEAGLLLMPSGQEVIGPDEHGNVTVSIAYTLAHADGDVWPTPLVAFGCGNDRAKNGSIGDKGVYKAITGANKYLLFKLFQIETGDDPEGDHGQEPAGNPASRGAGGGSSPAAPASANRTPGGETLTGRETGAVKQGPAPVSPEQSAFITMAKKALALAESATDVAEWEERNKPEAVRLGFRRDNEAGVSLRKAINERIAEIELADMPAGQLEAAE